MGLQLSERKRDRDKLYFDLILATINNICNKLNVRTLKAEFYEENDSLAVLVKADISKITENLKFLRDSLELAGEKLGIAIRVQKEDLFRYIHRI